MYIIYSLYLGPAYYGCHGFLCDNRTRCLSHSSVCSGYTSCRDGSDEANCCKRFKTLCVFAQVIPYSGNVWWEKVWRIWQMSKTIQTSHASYKAIGLYINLPNFFLPYHFSDQFHQTLSSPNIPAIWYLIKVYFHVCIIMYVTGFAKRGLMHAITNI